jgi:hypothetical protein
MAKTQVPPAAPDAAPIPGADEQAAPLVDLELENTALLEENAALKEIEAELKLTIESKDATIAELQELLATTANTGGSSVNINIGQPDVFETLPAIEHEGQAFQFLKPVFIINAKKYKAAEAAVLPEVIAAILEVEGQKILATA